MSAGPAPLLHLCAYADDLGAIAAERMLDEQAGTPGHLTQVLVLQANPLAAAQLRRHLLQGAARRGHAALLGPHIGSLASWIGHHYPATAATLAGPARELMLVESLRQYRQLFADEDPWRVSDSLLDLFDELSAEQVELPATLEELEQRLRKAYALQGANPAGMEREARIVHHLWRAWHTQLDAYGVEDPSRTYAMQLTRSIEDLSDWTVYIVGLQRFSRAETDWLRQALRRQRLRILLPLQRNDATQNPDAAATAWLTDLGVQLPDQARELPAPDAAGQLFDAAFPTSRNHLRERAMQLRESFASSPVAGKLQVLTASSAESEARAVDLQIRCWLKEGRAPLAVVTEDRRLARRIRALLERAGVELQDAGGWALSTTSAAAALERWLQTIEESFPQQAFLDLLKSPFVFPCDERDQHLFLVYRLEQDIIQHENIARGLDRYRTHLRYRRGRLKFWQQEDAGALDQLLQACGEAAAPLLPLLHGDHPAADYFAALTTSLQTLGMEQALEADAAGRRVLQVCEDLGVAATQQSLHLNWLEFRTWLGRSLERHTFTSSTQQGPVYLLSIEQARGCRFAGLVLAACDHGRLPGPPPQRPFFNDRVRRELGLAAWREHLLERMHDFRALLQAAPEVVLSWRSQEQGEPVLPSPWLDALQSLHRLAYGEELQAPRLQALLRTADAATPPPARVPLPQPQPAPSPRLPAGVRRTKLSAAAHQNLIDCPYRFFAADGLRLQPPEEVREALQKSDYGERVHRCLEAFHGPVKGLPAPFPEPLSARTRAAAIAHLTDISRQVFARDLEDNFEHRGWLQRWQDLIPAYIDWQIRRAADWTVSAVEQRGQHQVAPNLTLHGRLDRIDRNNAGLAVLDYKTGAAPTQEQVDSGEAVQLPSYALLQGDTVRRVEYLLLDQRRVRSGASLENEALDTLTQAVERRLRDLTGAIDDGAALPAWGDPDTCAYCDFDGVCRREAWVEENIKI